MEDEALRKAITAQEQSDIEERVASLYAQFLREGIDDDNDAIFLDRGRHAKYLHGGLGELPAGFCSLDASRTWICYWILHSLALLGCPPPAAPSRAAIIAFLATCQHPGGGFGGGPYQLPHLATTYAAVCALVTLGGRDALSVVDRPALRSFVLRMCVPPARGGGMTMHAGGEVDVRGCFCALACCHMLGLDKGEVAEACGLGAYVRACQSYEGGVGGEPWNEAHGGYSFCGFAALALAGEGDAIDGDALLRWAARMQGRVEGGFMGRTCKLVDGCYSFWQGGVFAPLQDLLEERSMRQAADASGGAGSEELRQAAARVAAELLNDDATAAFVEGLQPLAPLAAAEQRLERVKQRLDSAVDQSLQDEERLRAAGDETEAAQLKQQALASLEAAAEVQEAVERAQAHLAAVACSAPVLLQGYPSPATPDHPAPLYDAAALQLWVLAACQAPRGGLRDKPGKPADYYHTCYCLSGLAASQHSSGTVLGGARNLLAKAHPLCNVVEDKVEAALAYFAAEDSAC